MKDTSHLVAIQDRLSRERTRLAEATTEKEVAFRKVQVEQAERELDGEMKFLGMSTEQIDISDDDLLAELGI